MNETSVHLSGFTSGRPELLLTAEQSDRSRANGPAREKTVQFQVQEENEYEAMNVESCASTIDGVQPAIVLEVAP